MMEGFKLQSKITMEVDKQLENEYDEYLSFMYEYEEKNGHYPCEMSDGHWMPYSFSEWKEKKGKLKNYMNSY